MKWIKLFAIFLIISYVLPKQQPSFSSIKTDNRQAILERFFTKYKSPLNAKEFIQASDKYNLDWKLLPSVVCAESSCGKRCWNNCFGWGSGKIVAGPNEVAFGISSLSYYKKYRETRTLNHFALAYNAPFARDYEGKIRYFYSQLK